MNTKYTKTAKDIAFDKEKAKLQSQINKLEMQLRMKDKEIYILKEDYNKVCEERDKYKDWNDRLLEYMELSEKDLRDFINKEKKQVEIIKHLDAMQSIFTMMGRW